MVEIWIEPVVRIVAHGTIGRELGSHMIFGTILLNLVTGNTFRLGRSCVPDVTGRTLHNSRVSPGQGKSGSPVVKRRGLPCGSCMAYFTFNRNSGGVVIRCLSCRIFCLVTTFTFHRSSGITGSMATCTFCCDMCSGQWEVRQ